MNNIEKPTEMVAALHKYDDEPKFGEYLRTEVSTDNNGTIYRKIVFHPEGWSPGWETHISEEFTVRFNQG